MTITYTIPGAHTLDQLSEPTLDGHADENARDNCVAASVAEGLVTLTRKTFVGDEIKDSVYGQGYIGFESAARYVSYCGAQGVTLSPHNGSQADLVATIHREVLAGHPVVVTMPSNWSTPYPDPVHPSGSTHVGLAVGVGPSEIRVMNPWHGFMQDQSDAWWQVRLCEGQVWIMQLAGAATRGASPVWKSVDAASVADSRGVKAYHAMATYLRAHPTLGDVVPGCAGETYYDQVNSFLPLEGDTVLWWNTPRGSVVEGGGEVAFALFQELNRVRTQTAASVSALQTQLSAAEAKVASQQELPAATTNALKADIAGLKSAADALGVLTSLNGSAG